MLFFLSLASKRSDVSASKAEGSQRVQLQLVSSPLCSGCVFSVTLLLLSSKGSVRLCVHLTFCYSARLRSCRAIRALVEERAAGRVQNVVY